MWNSKSFTEATPYEVVPGRECKTLLAVFFEKSSCKTQNKIKRQKLKEAEIFKLKVSTSTHTTCVTLKFVWYRIVSNWPIRPAGLQIAWSSGITISKFSNKFYCCKSIWTAQNWYEFQTNFKNYPLPCNPLQSKFLVVSHRNSLTWKLTKESARKRLPGNASKASHFFSFSLYPLCFTRFEEAELRSSW